MAGFFRLRPGSPGNPTRRRDHFRWDTLHHQPHTDISKFGKLWASRTDIPTYLRLVTRNVRAVPSIFRRYRELLRRPAVRVPVDATAFGVAISPTREEWPRCIEALESLGVTSLSMRLPIWAPEPFFDLADEFARLHAKGFRFTFALVPDRDAVTSPDRFGAFARNAAGLFAPLSPTFQVGQVVNRKKWGIWHPDEYLPLVEQVAPLRESHPTCRWIGPPVIDFEYHFTIDYLWGPRPFDFDSVSSLLYVDRRGSPDAKQYFHFDLRRKILLLRAIVEASPHPDVPISLTEFNWPLRGAQEHNPAGPRVQIDEIRQARYLVLYYLTAASTGFVDVAVWWQLAAKGYGLIDTDAGCTQRRAYRALRVLVARTRGAFVEALPEALHPVRGFLLDRGADSSLLLYSTGARVPLPACAASFTLHDLAGEPESGRDFPAGSSLTLDDEPIYLRGSASDLALLVEALHAGAAGGR
jgi:hypothetical protein